MTNTDRPHDEAEHVDGDNVDGEAGRGRLIAEAAIGFVIAGLLAWVAAAAVTDIPFVYQGL